MPQAVEGKRIYTGRLGIASVAYIHGINELRERAGPVLVVTK